MDNELATAIATDPGTLDDLWDAQDASRSDIQTRRNYYDGYHAISGRGDTYSDGQPKAEVVTNFIKYVVNRYVGAIGEVQVSVDQPAEIDQEAETAPMRRDTSMDAVELYDALLTTENLRAKDRECLRNCLLAGYGIELHSYDEAAGPRVNVYPPDEWCVVRDTSDAPVLAIRRVNLKKSTVYEGAVLEDDTKIMTVYTATTVYTYRKAEKQRGQDTDWELVREDQHPYKRIPVVQWRINEQRKSIVSDAVLHQNDEYNEIDSAHGDSVRYDVDSMLKLSGIDGSWVEQNETTIREKRVLPLPDKECEAEYLVRSFDTGRVVERLARTRAHIHLMAEVPDVAKVVGATGSASGIALKLMFTPMEQAVAAYAPYIEQSIRERIELLNAVWKPAKSVSLDDYSVTVPFIMPVNRIEEWQNIAALDGIVSHKTQLRLLTDITKPDAELGQIEQEALELGEPADAREAVEAQDAEIAAKAVDMESVVQEVITNLSAATTDYMITSGALDRAVKAKEK